MCSSDLAIVALDRFNSPASPPPSIGDVVPIAFAPEALVLLEHA